MTNHQANVTSMLVMTVVTFTIAVFESNMNLLLVALLLAALTFGENHE